MSGNIGSLSTRDSIFIKTNIFKIKPSESELSDGFESTLSTYKITTPDGPIIISRLFCKGCMCNPEWDVSIEHDKDSVAIHKILFAIIENSFFLRPLLISNYRKSQISRQPLVNEKKIAIMSILSCNSKKMKIFRSDYFSSLLTAELTQLDVIREMRHTNKISEISSAESRSPFVKSGNAFNLRELDDFSQPMSLHLGVNCIALSSDNVFRITIQSEHNLVSRNLRAPLGSGSADWDDYSDHLSLNNLICKAAERELKEEWVTKHPNHRGIEIRNIEPIGYFRIPHRAGKPEFVTLAKLSNPDSDLLANGTETLTDESPGAKSTHMIRDLNSLREIVLSALRSRTSPDNSVPLLGSMLSLLYAIEDSPECIRRVLEIE